MASRDHIAPEITPQVLLKAYAVGIFPMAESADVPGLYWIEPEQRGIIPLDGFHISRRLARTDRRFRPDRLSAGCGIPGPIFPIAAMIDNLTDCRGFGAAGARRACVSMVFCMVVAHIRAR